MTLRKAVLFISLLVFIQACSTNPVTGKSQLSMPIGDQIEMGKQNYGPSQQQQGGRYLVDTELGLYVSQVGQKLAAQSDLKLPYEFVVLNNDVPNAWALPGGKIAVNRGLLVLLEDEAQLAAVLGHEIVHAAAEHGATQMRKSQVLGLGVMVAGVASKDSDYGAALTAGAAVGAQAWQAHYGRDQELEADKYGIRYMASAGYEPQAAVELQKTFVELSRSSGKQDAISALFASHPPSEERVRKNTQQTQNLPGGTRNKAAYQRAIQTIKKDIPAYKLNQEALGAAAEGNLDKALSLSNSAIAKQPKEALFYLTKGRILAEQNKEKDADKALRSAVDLNPEYFLSHLFNGINAKKLGNTTQAKSSLESSMNLLATQPAAYYLGEIELSSGNKKAALEYFNFAAQGGGDLGEKAKQQAEKLQPTATSN